MTDASVDAPPANTWPRAQPFVVHKFGGTSVGSVAAIRKVLDIIEGVIGPPTPPGSPVAGPPGTTLPEDIVVGDGHVKARNLAVVVSAMGGKPKVTDMLLDLVSLAAKGKTAEYTALLDAIEKKHMDTIVELLPEELWDSLRHEITKDFNGLRDLLRAVVVMKADDERTRELVSGHGEVWSAKMITALLNSRGHRFVCVDAREVLVVRHTDVGDGREVQWEESTARLQALLHASPPGCHLVVTGFIASTTEGVMTTLRRDGSDYSASIFGRLLLASSVTIWTDVSGVYSADPRVVPEARVVPFVSYNEACELAYFGAKVIHPKTMNPAIGLGIPIYIRNTFSPGDEGTCIGPPAMRPSPPSYMLPASATAPSSSCTARTPSHASTASSSSSMCHAGTVVGLSNVDNLALCSLEGPGLIGVVGAASKLFAALQRAAVNAVLIAQASSEHSICVAVPAGQASAAAASIHEAFYREMHLGDVNPVTFTAPVSIVAAVGDGMHSVPGVAGRFFGALARCRTNVLAISQGSSQRNISAVVATPAAPQALRAVHAAFLSDGLEVSLGVIGGVDNAAHVIGFLSQLRATRQRLWERYRVRLVLRGVVDGHRMALTETDMPVEDDGALPGVATWLPSNVEAFIAHVKAPHLSHCVVVDCCASGEASAALYPAWLTAGVHIVTANDAAGSCDPTAFADIKAAYTGAGRAKYYDECSVLVGIPVLQALHDLRSSGDAVTSIDLLGAPRVNAALTRTCTAIADKTESLPSFSRALAGHGDVINEASGEHDARTLVALARRAGIVDATVSKVTRQDLTCDASDVDDVVARAAASAVSRGCVLRYIARLTCRHDDVSSSSEPTWSASVGLQEIPVGHPFFALPCGGSSGVTAVALRTQLYGEDSPIVLQCPAPTPTVIGKSLCGQLTRLAASISSTKQATR